MNTTTEKSRESGGCLMDPGFKVAQDKKLELSANRLRIAVALVAIHAPRYLFKKTTKINGVPFLVCVDRLGVYRTFDPATGELVDESMPGRPDVLARPKR